MTTEGLFGRDLLAGQRAPEFGPLEPAADVVNADVAPIAAGVAALNEPDHARHELSGGIGVRRGAAEQGHRRLPVDDEMPRADQRRLMHPALGPIRIDNEAPDIELPQHFHWQPDAMVDPGDRILVPGPDAEVHRIGAQRDETPMFGL
jgi:hypothetical protein